MSYKLNKKTKFNKDKIIINTKFQYKSNVQSKINVPLYNLTVILKILSAAGTIHNMLFPIRGGNF